MRRLGVVTLPITKERKIDMTVKAVQENIVPPTINHEEGDNDPEIDYNMNWTFNKAQEREINAALSNTFGFGGHNAALIIKKYKG